ncbi:MAG: HEPN domain-containing protein [Bacteroidales bacterium]|nr:MAG: HEPN domain-containing protein [Bacteroidales bacterium]
MPNTQEEYIAYRIERAWRTFNDAKALAETQSWNSSMNRLYYACFYAVLALFAKHEINSHTHSGVKTQLALHFIKTGKLDKTLGMLYTDLFDFRQKGDYGDFFDFEEENVTTLFPHVEQFIKEIETLTKL